MICFLVCTERNYSSSSEDDDNIYSIEEMAVRKAIDGRNRRYYKITEKGDAQLNLYKVEWKNYSAKISKILGGEKND